MLLTTEISTSLITVTAKFSFYICNCKIQFSITATAKTCRLNFKTKLHITNATINHTDMKDNHIDPMCISVVVTWICSRNVQGENQHYLTDQNILSNSY